MSDTRDEDKEIYIVNVSIDFDMCVLAKSNEEAEELARRHHMQEYEALGISMFPNTMFSAKIVKSNELEKINEDLLYSIPWGSERDHLAIEIFNLRKNNAR